MRRRAILRPATRSHRSAIFFLALASLCLFAPRAHAQGAIPGPPPPQNPGQQKGVIKANVDLVVLHATVDDEKGQFVGDLKQDSFRVFEDKVEQKISLFSREDIPVTMGMVIENSGSMREMRAQVIEAALTFVKTSNPRDEAFVVNFNDEYYLDLNEDFSSDQKELNEALSRIDSRGSTALYDAIIGSLDHLN